MDLDQGFKEHVDEVDAYEGQLQDVYEVKPDLQRFHQQCEELEFPSLLTHFNEYRLAFEKEK